MALNYIWVREAVLRGRKKESFGWNTVQSFDWDHQFLC
jgi:hypothetical protein